MGQEEALKYLKTQNKPLRGREISDAVGVDCSHSLKSLDKQGKIKSRLILYYGQWTKEYWVEGNVKVYSPGRFKPGHKISDYTRRRLSETHKNKSVSRITRYKIGQSRLGENNPFWKGNSAKKKAVHLWIKSRMWKPEVCPICQIRQVRDLVNISGRNKRDIIDWAYICRSCMKKGAIKLWKKDWK